ncbi:hypothetical protein IWW48_005191, partial [Coemansia sp. RSA 1200]
MEQFIKDEYIELSKSYASICKQSNLSEALGILGADWNGAWDSFCANQALTGSKVIERILKEYRSKCAGIRAQWTANNVSEKTYQTAFGALAEAIQDHVASFPDTMPGMYWDDTHNKLIERADGRKRKPDGCFLADHSAGLLWQNIAIAVEIKGDSMDGGHDLIRGQLLQDFIDMSEILPRRFMIGLTLGRGSEVHLYVCVPGGIRIVSLSKLPLLHGTRLLPNRTGAIADKNLVVKFLLFLHQQFATDCGYLTGCDSTFPCEFRLSDILGVLQNKNSVLRPSTIIRFNCAYDDAKVLGRHSYLKGQRTWAYPAQYFYDKRDRPRNAFFKFQWAFDDEPEISVHQFVLDNGVPH